MNFKSILKRALALFTVASLLYAITTPALAEWKEHGSGVCSSGNVGSYPLGYGANNLSWRVNLFVSTKSDGSIDPQTSNIPNQTGLALVGSIIFTQANLTDAQLFVQQDNDSALHRSSSVPTLISNGPGMMLYNFPRVREWDGSSVVAGTLGVMAGIYAADNCYITGDSGMFQELGLPNSVDIVASKGYRTAVKDVIERTSMNAEGKSYNVFINTVMHALHDISPDYDDFLSNILTAVSSNAALYAKLMDVRNTTTDAEFVQRLYPSSPEPLVGWVATVEPMFAFCINSTAETGGIQYTNSFCFTPTTSYLISGDNRYIGRYYPKVWYTGDTNRAGILLLDAYAAARYNSISKSVFTANSVNDYLYDTYGVIVNNSCASEYSSAGQLRKEFSSRYFENVASVAYVDEATSTYYGIYTSNASTAWTDSNMMLKGGITVVDQPIETTQVIPVYYYIYDENNNPTGEVIVEYYIPDGNGFIPSTEYGIPIADEAVSFTDSQLTDSSGNPGYYYCDEDSALRPKVIDSKGTSDEYEWRNPKAIIEPLNVGTRS